VYGICGFAFKIKLSTRPEKYIGELSVWDEAESKLKTALDKFTGSVGSSWEEKPGDGAFYGPKIDVELTDALQREHQCGTIQLDFDLPRRFKLRFKEKESVQSASANDHSEEDLPAGYARPVMIHRAVFGSFERMFGVLTEHFGGKWPFWLSPWQVLVIPVMPALNDYAEEVRDLFRDRGLYVDADLSGNTLQKKIRSGQLEQYNLSSVRDTPHQLPSDPLVVTVADVKFSHAVVGAEEQKSRTVNIRNRDDAVTHAKGELVPLSDAVEHLVRLRDERRLQNRL
jgi:threonyl-tRNA synthetase